MSTSTATLLDRNQTAQILGVSLRTVAKLIADGELKVVRIGASVRVRPSSIDYFCEARETSLSSKRRKAIRGAGK